jgi:excisionase family DNA binding protein
MDTYLTAIEVAELVKLSVQTIRRYTMNKEIPFHKINRTVRYKKTEIEQWVENWEEATADTLFGGEKCRGEND